MIFKKWVENLLIVVLALNSVAWIGAVNNDLVVPAVITTALGFVIIWALGMYGRGARNE